AGIPVVGHLGLTPQSINVFGGYKVQGKDADAAQKLLDDARALEEAGAFAVVLECVPVPLAKLVTEKIGIPTIGIGAGPYCSGQVLVIHDMLGFSGRFAPKFVKRYANLHEIISQSLRDFRAEVENSAFPSPEYSFAMDETVLKNIK
ncbi:MAG: 3-methyl-2-oxobutanoate hydroxymethyltransferase, partial [Firmicutes bacterium]|nr:3-methyl-2-oxobutanoate hydroxymethyltransferase [Bacillota bacterium]